MTNALNTIQAICDEWNALKDKQAGRGGYLFNYKLHELAAACDDNDDFNNACLDIAEEWERTVQDIAGYAPDKWAYNKYFEHDNHNGSYFNFAYKSDSDTSLDFWANSIGLEWDITQGAAWEFTPFEKAINAVYGVTRFSTDRLTPEAYSAEEIEEITQNLTEYVIPRLRAELAERTAIINAYNDIKAHQLDYAPDTRVIVQEVAPSQVDFDRYFDDDGLTSDGGINCAVYIPANGNQRGFNAAEYNSIVSDIYRILSDYDRGLSMWDAVEDCGYSGDILTDKTRLTALIEWAKTAEPDEPRTVAEFLTITTDEPWAVRAFNGYSQGSYCEVIYCTAHHSDECINDIGNFWLGCGTEFVIDDCSGYYVLDTVRHAEGAELLNTLADFAGVEPERLTVYLYDGEHTTADYKIMEVV